MKNLTEDILLKSFFNPQYKDNFYFFGFYIIPLHEKRCENDIRSRMGRYRREKKKGQKRVSLHVWTGNPPLWTETFADTTFYFYPTSLLGCVFVAHRI